MAEPLGYCYFERFTYKNGMLPLNFLWFYAFTAHEAGVNTVIAWLAVEPATPKRTEEQRLHAVGPVQVNGTHSSVNRLSLNWKFHNCFSLF
jgi:hypothetical protein